MVVCLILFFVMFLAINPFVYFFCQVMLCSVTRAWAPIMMTATDRAPNLAQTTLMHVLPWWAMTVSPTDAVLF